MNSTVQGSAKPKGKPRGASRKGIPNKATQQAREAIAQFVDGNSHRLQEWLDKIADGVRDEVSGGWLVPPDPLRAFQSFQSVIEYHVPKLQRTDMTHSGEVTVKTFHIKKVKAPDADR